MNADKLAINLEKFRSNLSSAQVYLYNTVLSVKSLSGFAKQSLRK